MSSFKERLEDDLLPAAELVRQKAAGGRQRRKISVFQELVGSTDGEAVKIAQVAPEPCVVWVVALRLHHYNMYNASTPHTSHPFRVKHLFCF